MSTVHSSHHHSHFVEVIIDWEQHHDTAVAIMTLIIGFLLCSLLFGIAFTRITPPKVAPYSEVYPVYTPYTF